MYYNYIVCIYNGLRVRDYILNLIYFVEFKTIAFNQFLRKGIVSLG